jgi:hypothetical protein
VMPRILVPMVCTAHELEAVTALINKVAGQVTPLCCLAIRRQFCGVGMCRSARLNSRICFLIQLKCGRYVDNS